MASTTDAKLAPRTRVCITCRSVLAEGESCGAKHRIAGLDAKQGREMLLNEVWGPPSLRRQVRRLAKAGGGGAAAGSIFDGCNASSGCDGVGDGGEIVGAILLIIAVALVAVVLVWLISKAIVMLRDHLNRPKPHGALLPPPSSVGVAVHGVVVGPADRADSPVRDDACLGYALEYRASRVIGRATTLIDSATRGFELKLDDGRRVRVPPGSIRLYADARTLGGEAKNLARAHLGDVDPLRDPTFYAEVPTDDAIPFDSVRESLLFAGDRVELRAPLEPLADPEIAGGYREGSSLMAPVGIAEVHVLARGPSHDA